MEIAEIIKNEVFKLSSGKIKPKIRIVDRGEKSIFTSTEKNPLRFDMKCAQDFLHFNHFTPPKESIEKIVKSKLHS